MSTNQHNFEKLKVFFPPAILRCAEKDTWKDPLQNITPYYGWRDFSDSPVHPSLRSKHRSLRLISTSYTPGSTNIAGWKMGAPDSVDVFPIENLDIPASYVIVYWRVVGF